MALVIGEIRPGFQADDTANATMILLPPQNGGAVGWGSVYLSFGCDFGDVTLRTAVWGNGSWRVGELKVTSAGGRVNLPIKDGDHKVSIGRIKSGPTDTGTTPVGYMIETTLKA
ncbi:hypothetical protein [Streptomyces sp. NPDC096033]|uniref:hypothetical protein n=1 Tax=Streptomyces sp. NPDC096033 TaxID=3366071 RepID=UPI00380BEF11